MNSKHSEIDGAGMKSKSFLGTSTHEKKKHPMKKYFYTIVITFLGTGVWNSAQGRIDDQRGQRGNTEVSMVTIPWENHNKKGRKQLRSLGPRHYTL